MISLMLNDRVMGQDWLAHKNVTYCTERSFQECKAFLNEDISIGVAFDKLVLVWLHV